MGIEYVCDNCGKRAAGRFNVLGGAVKPEGWFQRTIPHVVTTTLLACSRECANALDKKNLTTSGPPNVCKTCGGYGKIVSAISLVNGTKALTDCPDCGGKETKENAMDRPKNS